MVFMRPPFLFPWHTWKRCICMVWISAHVKWVTVKKHFFLLFIVVSILHFWRIWVDGILPWYLICHTKKEREDPWGSFSAIYTPFGTIWPLLYTPLYTTFITSFHVFQLNYRVTIKLTTYTKWLNCSDICWSPSASSPQDYQWPRKRRNAALSLTHSYIKQCLVLR